MADAIPLVERWESDADKANQFRIIPPEESYIRSEATSRFSSGYADDLIEFAKHTGKLKALAKFISEHPNADVLEVAEAVEAMPQDEPPIKERSY